MNAPLLVTVPPGRAAAREWIVRTLLERRLGQSVEVVAGGKSGWTTISVPGHDGELKVADRLLAEPAASWLRPASLPRDPPGFLATDECVGAGDLPFARVAAIYRPEPGEDGPPNAGADAFTAAIPFDLFGSAFFMLTRYEECVDGVKDAHGRFPASASAAARGGFLDVPVVDQYVELLWRALIKLWPGLTRPATRYRLWVTHDVDSLWLTYRSSRRRQVASAVRWGATDLFRWHSVAAAAGKGRSLARTLRAGVHADAHFNLDRVMDIDEAHGLRGTFFFIAQLVGPYHSPYSLEDPLVQGFLREIGRRGHEVGLHASYISMDDGECLAAEWRRLRDVASALGIEQPVWGSRAHFLRWSPSRGFRDAEAAGAGYDTTLAFADLPGFRCGTCHEYQAFDLVGGRPLRLVERPPIGMEFTVLDQQYMGLPVGERSLAVFKRLADQCRTYGGTFTMLWHNHNLANRAQVELYQAVLESCG